MKRCYISGCSAAAEAARLADVDVIAAYPITPQTHIVEALSQYVHDGRLKAEFIPVESEYSAISAVAGAALVGARAFTATSSQGLALMHEVLHYTSGLRLPLVMAVANRALASPVSIFTDHQDILTQRETGFLQFYAESCQEILDLILIAYRVAEDERVLLPVMVSFDGFFLSHTNEPVEIPEDSSVKLFLPGRGPKYPILDLDDPKIFNVMAFPEHFEEFQRDKYESMAGAADVFDEACRDFENIFQRSHRRIESYRVEDADYVLVGLGSMMGTVAHCIDQLRSGGDKVGMIKIKSYRPFPVGEIASLGRQFKGIGVLDRDVAFGTGGIVFQDICRSLLNVGGSPPVMDFIVGLGGRDVSVSTVKKCFDLLASGSGRLEPGKDVFWPDENKKLLSIWKVGEQDGR